MRNELNLICRVDAKKLVVLLQALHLSNYYHLNHQFYIHLIEIINNLIQKPASSMTNLQTFKYVFTANLGELILKANITSPTFATWKRSQESATSQTVDMANGKADFKNEILKLPVNMYFDRDAKCFQEKKTSFSFTMKTPKGEKTAGVVYVDLSKMLNNRIEQMNQDFPLQKCPVKDSTVRIKIVFQCLGEKANDTSSQASINTIGNNMSTLSVISVSPTIQVKSQEVSLKKASAPTTISVENDKDKEIKQLKQKLAELTKQNQSLKKELETAKQSVKGDNIKQQFMKSKALQDKLEDEVNSLKKQNQEHEKQLEQVRHKLQETYKNLYSNLSNHFL